MRKFNDQEPRLAALSEADLAAERRSRSWMPSTITTRTVLDPAHWSPRAREASYLRLVGIWARAVGCTDELRWLQATGWLRPEQDPLPSGEGNAAPHPLRPLPSGEGQRGRELSGPSPKPQAPRPEPSTHAHRPVICTGNPQAICFYTLARLSDHRPMSFAACGSFAGYRLQATGRSKTLSLGERAT